VLQYVEKEGPNDAKKRQARGLMNYLKVSDFVLHLQLMLLILGHANSLSLLLQRKDKHLGGHVRGEVNQAKISAN
jgi:hypothetical protein